ncbi:MAG: hypothetical protein LBD23_18410 [Oscillospiraceae bacterium]|jgi:acyl carrier protein|nr:hypothetical protein [Oscillospiraceae bacterium]
MCEDKKEVENQIVSVIKKLFPHTKDMLSENTYNRPLTGQPVDLNGAMMIYLFFELEKKFKLTFLEEDVIEYRFYTIEQITECIYKKRLLLLNST